MKLRGGGVAKYLENNIRPGRKGMEAMMMYVSVTSHRCNAVSLACRGTARSRDDARHRPHRAPSARPVLATPLPRQGKASPSYLT
jgi:hypothetical protein